MANATIAATIDPLGYRLAEGAVVPGHVPVLTDGSADNIGDQVERDRRATKEQAYQPGETPKRYLDSSHNTTSPMPMTKTIAGRARNAKRTQEPLPCSCRTSPVLLPRAGRKVVTVPLAVGVDVDRREPDLSCHGGKAFNKAPSRPSERNRATAPGAVWLQIEIFCHLCALSMSAQAVPAASLRRVGAKKSRIISRKREVTFPAIGISRRLRKQHVGQVGGQSFP